jgi:Fe2+ transport system protein B
LALESKISAQNGDFRSEKAVLRAKFQQKVDDYAKILADFEEKTRAGVKNLRFEAEKARENEKKARENEKKWQKRAENAEIALKMAENRPKLTENRPKMTENRPKMTEIRPKMTEIRPERDILSKKTRDLAIGGFVFFSLFYFIFYICKMSKKLNIWVKKID